MKMTIITPSPTPRTCFAFLVYGEGGVGAILNQEVEERPGSAARSTTVVQVEGNLLKSEYFRADNITVTPLWLPLELL